MSRLAAGFITHFNLSETTQRKQLGSRQVSGHKRRNLILLGDSGMSASPPLSPESFAAQRMSALPFGRHLSASARSIGECLTLFGFDLDQCSKAFF